MSSFFVRVAGRNQRVGWRAGAVNLGDEGSGCIMTDGSGSTRGVASSGTEVVREHAMEMGRRGGLVWGMCD